MNSLNIGENILNLRRKKGITQEELAEFIGVTKGSVSKWETKQSFPDILLLPRLAAFFDVSLDQLLGYSPQLSKEQIKKEYGDLAHGFAQCPFEEAMEKSRELVKAYYSCYPLLLQIAVLWLNHHVLAPTPEGAEKVLEEAANLCQRIEDNSEDMALARNGAVLKASINLVRGRVTEAVEALEPLTDPYSFEEQSDLMLIQAYQIAGDREKAEAFAQMTMYRHLLSLVGSAQEFLAIHTEDRALGEETIARVKAVADSYKLDELHPNLMANFHYRAGIFYMAQGDKEKALEHLEIYAKLCREILENFNLHGDDYFTALDQWIAQGDLGAMAPRDKKVVLEGAIDSLSHPTLAPLADEPKLKIIITELRKEGENL